MRQEGTESMGDIEYHQIIGYYSHDHNISLQAGTVDGVLLHHHTVALHLIAHLALAIEVADDGEE